MSQEQDIAVRTMPHQWPRADVDKEQETKEILEQCRDVAEDDLQYATCIGGESP